MGGTEPVHGALTPHARIMGEANTGGHHLGLVTHKGFQAGQKLEDALLASLAEDFIVAEASPHGEVSEAKEGDVGMIGIVALREKSCTSAVFPLSRFSGALKQGLGALVRMAGVMRRQRRAGRRRSLYMWAAV